MSLVSPQLDDRRYEGIIDELRSRVPNYAPEWTDQDDPDSGNALLELFAWLVGMVLYSLHQGRDTD